MTFLRNLAIVGSFILCSCGNSNPLSGPPTGAVDMAIKLMQTSTGNSYLNAYEDNNRACVKPDIIKCKDLKLDSFVKYDISDADRANGVTEKYLITISYLFAQKKNMWDPNSREFGEWIQGKVGNCLIKKVDGTWMQREDTNNMNAGAPSDC